MTRREEVLRLLADVGLPLDDDAIAERLNMNRHVVNGVCRQLADAGILRRTAGPRGKLVNSISPGATGVETKDVMAKTSIRRRNTPRRERAKTNVNALIDDFSRYVEVFEASEAFPGPSLYFHERALTLRRGHRDATSLLDDEQFLEYVYAVLPAWGMHRMGKQAAKVGPFEAMVKSFRLCRPAIGALWTRRITDVAPGEVDDLAAELWDVISQLRVSTSSTRIVAGSKALHHVLPELVPPIDRQYTFRFFTGQMSVTGGDKAAFLEWFPHFCEIGRECRNIISGAIERGGFMATGPAKVIDNAIMGFMQTRGKGLDDGLG